MIQFDGPVEKKNSPKHSSVLSLPSFAHACMSLAHTHYNLRACTHADMCLRMRLSICTCNTCAPMMFSPCTGHADVVASGPCSWHEVVRAGHTHVWKGRPRWHVVTSVLRRRAMPMSSLHGPCSLYKVRITGHTHVLYGRPRRALLCRCSMDGPRPCLRYTGPSRCVRFA